MTYPFRRVGLARVAALLLSLLASTRALTAAETPPAATAPRPPEKLVAELCSNCHGRQLTGIPAPNLLDWFWIHGGRDEEVLRSIRNGYPDAGMPGFAGILSDAEMRGLLSFIRTQSRAFDRGEITLPVPPAEMIVRSEKHTFKIETLFSGLDHPWGLQFLPDGTMLFTERAGRLRIVKNGVLDPKPIAGLPQIYVKQDGGLLDITAHPDYAKNGWLYLAYTETGEAPQSSGTVIIRGKIRDGRWVDQETLFRAEQKFYTVRDTSHYGCRFYWDPTGHLFFTIGDRGRPEDAQLLTSPLGKIHRVNADGTIPADNPFVKTPGALGSIWSYGHRHPQGLFYHPVTGRLWETEHGPTGGDEVNVITPGHNYGWPIVSAGTDPIRKFESAHEGMDSPLATWTPSIAPSGIEFCTSPKFPRWKNSLLITALGGQQIVRLETDGDRVTHQEILFKEVGRVRDITTGPDGLLYVAFDGPYRIARISPMPDDTSATSLVALPATTTGSSAIASSTSAPTSSTSAPATIATNAYSSKTPGVTRAIFGRSPEGVEVESYTLTNRHGYSAKILTTGAIIAELNVPGRDGKLVNVVRDVAPTPEGFTRGFPQAAAVFGRFANRIAGAKFTLDGREYTLAANNRPNHIHGGPNNFSRKNWTATTTPGTAAVTLTYVSIDGEEGYPGKMTTTLRYTLTDDDALRLEYSAVTDAPTILNLTNHAYFNLAGSGDVLDHEVTFNADRYTVVDSALIPTGEIRSVTGTPLDFTTPTPLGARAAQLGTSRRYDHNFVINRPAGDDTLRLAARVAEKSSGRVMETWTTQPGVQLYTSPLGDKPVTDQRGFFCLETQHYPDSIHQPSFPTVILRPGETFRATTEFRFSVK